MKKDHTYETIREKERVFLIGLEIKGENNLLSMQDSLNELVLLSETADLDVVGSETQRIDKPNPATFIGSGKVEEIRDIMESLKADIVIFDGELSPRNFRELEKSFQNKVRVIDRTTLILDIFAQHAHTSEGKLQVQLAQYEYLYPRLTKAWSHLARQAGGGGGRTGGTGGVGLRGPGETQLEVDRRRIREKISQLKEDLEKVREHRSQHRKIRKQSQLPVIALVGYTNAGKSTLLNSLTNSDIFVADQLFTTLDPTTRRLELPNGNVVLLTDTVGFIQKLPTHLIAAFRATLEEISDAQLLMHVVDITHDNMVHQWRSVIDTLKDINAGSIPMLTVLNKTDKLQNPEIINKIHPEFEGSIFISAKEKLGFKELYKTINEELFEKFSPIKVSIPYKNGQLISLFHQFGRIEQIEHGAEYVNISGSIPGRLISDFKNYKQRKSY